MATRRRKASASRPGRNVKAVPAKSLTVEFEPRHKNRPARKSEAIAHGKVVAAMFELATLPPVKAPSTASARKPEALKMFDDTVRETIKRRWRSERPFQGMTTEAIVKKLQANVLNPTAADQANRELSRRGYKARPS